VTVQSILDTLCTNCHYLYWVHVRAAAL